MTKAVRINVDGTMRIVNLNGYDELKDAVGGIIEHISLSSKLSAYVHEEGKLIGLPINSLASELCESHLPGFLTRDLIVGVMVVFGPQDKDGNDTDISEAGIEEIVNLQEKALDIDL